MFRSCNSSKHFKPYLRGVPVTIITDHAALKLLLSQKEPKGRIPKWIAFIQQFDFTVKPQPGKSISHVDGLSRKEYYEDPKMDKILMKRLAI